MGGWESHLSILGPPIAVGIWVSAGLLSRRLLWGAPDSPPDILGKEHFTTRHGLCWELSCQKQ